MTKKRTIKFGPYERLVDELLWFPELPPDGKKDGKPRLCLMAEEWGMISHFMKKFKMTHEADELYGLVLYTKDSRYQIKRQGDHLNIVNIDDPNVSYDILEFVRAFGTIEKLMKKLGHKKMPDKFNKLFEFV
jgi:hypothetical protein